MSSTRVPVPAPGREPSDQSPGQPSRQSPGQPSGQVRLLVPPDWFDLMADGSDRDATRVRCAELVLRTYPETRPERREDFVDGLMVWYDQLFADGVLMYGVITAPLPTSGEQAAWQVYAGVVPVPATPAEMDLGALVSRIFAGRLHTGAAPGDASGAGTFAYVEQFATEIGLGFGFISQPPVQVPDDWEGELPGNLPPAPRTGLAGALACPPEGGKGLLVIGTSLDPDQVRELAGLVAVIAGHSTFTNKPPQAPDHPGRTGGDA